MPADADTIAQELFVFALGGRGAARARARSSRATTRAAQMTVKLASMSSDLVFEQVERAERLAEGGVRRHRHHGTDDRIRPAVQHARSLPGDVAAQQLRHRVRHGVRRDLRRLPLVPLRPARPSRRTCCPVLAVLGVMGWLGISMNIATVMVASVALGIVDDDTIHFISRYRREVAAGADTDDGDRDRDRARRARVADDGDHQQLRLRRAAAVRVQADGLVRRPAGADDGVAFLAEVFILPATIKLLPRVFGAEALRAAPAARAA